MFKKLFSTPQVTQPKKQQSQSSYEVAVIEEIHNSFDSAANQALAEEKRILSRNDITEEKRSHVELLLKAGFHNAKQVTETQEARAKREAANKRAQKVQYFQQKYPQYKFIFADQVDAICQKYNLICGDIYRYMGEVPPKNLKEIIDFKISDEDFVYDCGITNRSSWGYSTRNTLSDLVNSGNLLNKEEFEKMESEHEKWVNENWKGNDQLMYNGKPTAYMETVQKQICAPAREMKVYGHEKVENNKIVAVPDPIVLHVVKGGFLIVSKWGIEGQDTSLTNEVMN